MTQRFSTEFELQQVRLDSGRVHATRSKGPQPCSGCWHHPTCPWQGAPAPTPGPPGSGQLLSLSGGQWGQPGAPRLFQLLFPRQLEQFKADNQDTGFGSGTRALEQALERTRTNINWVNENQQKVLAWFQGETGSS